MVGLEGYLLLQVLVHTPPFFSLLADNSFSINLLPAPCTYPRGKTTGNRKFKYHLDMNRNIPNLVSKLNFQYS